MIGPDMPDVRSGVQVTLRDENNTVVAFGELGEGAIVPDATTENHFGSCRFTFSLTDVKPATIYNVTVGNRPPTQLRPEEIVDGVHLSYGDTK